MIEPLELIATSEEELQELAEFVRSSGLELLAIVAIAVPAEVGADHRGDEGAAA